MKWLAALNLSGENERENCLSFHSFCTLLSLMDIMEKIILPPATRGKGGIYWNRVFRPSIHEFVVERSSVLDIEVEIWFPGSRVLCFHLERLYHTYRLPWEEDVPYQTWGQRSSTLDIEVNILFLGSRVTPYHTYGQAMGCKVPKILLKPFIHSGKQEFRPHKKMLCFH
jgi:hypothetical protein